MSDRELLEAAARAAGIKVLRSPDGVLRNCTNTHPDTNIYGCPAWNPLLDDGDALRLAVKLKLFIAFFDERVNVYDNEGVNVFEMYGSDSYAATRRAITRAAAAIGGLSSDPSKEK